VFRVKIISCPSATLWVAEKFCVGLYELKFSPFEYEHRVRYLFEYLSILLIQELSLIFPNRNITP